MQENISDKLLTKLVNELTEQFSITSDAKDIKIMIRKLKVPNPSSPSFLSFGFVARDINAKFVLDITISNRENEEETLSRLFTIFDKDEYRFVKDFEISDWWTDDYEEEEVVFS